MEVYDSFMNINEMSVNFGLQVKYFSTDTILGNPTEFHDLIYILRNCQANMQLIN